MNNYRKELKSIFLDPVVVAFYGGRKTFEAVAADTEKVQASLRETIGRAPG
jgi:hypothetical protein